MRRDRPAGIKACTATARALVAFVIVSVTTTEQTKLKQTPSSYTRQQAADTTAMTSVIDARMTGAQNVKQNRYCALKAATEKNKTGVEKAREELREAVEIS